jgi:hypothetical protein
VRLSKAVINARNLTQGGLFLTVQVEQNRRVLGSSHGWNHLRLKVYFGTLATRDEGPTVRPAISLWSV